MNLAVGYIAQTLQTADEREAAIVNERRRRALERRLDEAERSERVEGAERAGRAGRAERAAGRRGILHRTA
ncbi:hypothetical protein [Agromyces italicus]|uniref:hypothetical protein n=1 Tax=Agromyces italicus TaxID=279572 RepID=UPI0003B47489|nr:hypothetical protein [Agromyces italicus]